MDKFVIFNNISKKSTWETILGYLNNISQYCNLENVNGCTSQNPDSEIHSYPDSLHTVIGEGSTDQTPLDAIQCVDTLDLKVPSSPYTSTSFYDNFLENITTQAYTQDCPFTYTPTNEPTSLNKNFLLGYATQYGFDNRQGHCGEGFINTFPCFDDYVGNITATVVDLTYHNTPTGYLSTITPKGLQIEQYAKIIAENPRLRVYQGVYVWNHRFSYWFGGTCGFIDGTCLDNTDQTCSPCFIKMHPYDEINSSYLCNGNLLSPPACSPQLECPPFTEGVVNWKFLLNTNCYNAKEFVREEDGNVKALFITYSNIQNSDYDILYNQISAKPTNNDWFPLCEPCPGTCTITVKFKTYVIPDQLIVFFDNDGDGLYAEQTDSTDELILDTGFISTENDFDEYTFVFSDNPETDYEYDIKDICKLQFCVIGNDDPDTAWNIEISGCHFDPTFVASGSSGGFCTMLYTTPDNEYERPIISSDGVPSGFVVYPSDDEYDSDNPNPYNQQIITCYQCNSGNCDSVSVQVDTGQTCEDYGLYTDSSTCNEECAADGDGSDSSPPP